MITRAVCPVMAGREEELSRVEDALLAACRRDGSVAVLVGEAGVGKSRLAAEIAQRAQKIGAVVMGVQVEPAPAEAPAPAQPEVVGERLVTVMFADVRGFTAITVATAPAEMTDRISSYRRWAKQEIERQHGLVDKFAGDAVMATFNISGTEVDHTLHALKAGLALRDKAALLGLPVGIGIAVGAAVVGKLTGGANTSVLGETTNLAARLQAQAEPGEVVLSAEAWRRLRGWFDEHAYEALGEDLQLKGFAEPVRAYRMRRSGDSVLELR